MNIDLESGIPFIINYRDMIRLVFLLESRHLMMKNILKNKDVTSDENFCQNLYNLIQIVLLILSGQLRLSD